MKFISKCGKKTGLLYSELRYTWSCNANDLPRSPVSLISFSLEGRIHEHRGLVSQYDRYNTCGLKSGQEWGLFEMPSIMHSLQPFTHLTLHCSMLNRLGETIALFLWYPRSIRDWGWFQISIHLCRVNVCSIVYLIALFWNGCSLLRAFGSVLICGHGNWILGRSIFLVEQVRMIYLSVHLL